MNAKLGDTNDSLFVRLRNHPKAYPTPHIAGFSDVTNLIGNNMMIDNLEAWFAGKPINVFGQ
jgi:phosphoglycerate dehydrogenase-like enzyme